MTKFTAKHLCQNLFFNKAESLQLYWKRGSGTDVFLWISRNFSEHLFDRTPPGDCFWREKIETCICIVEWYLVIRKTKTFPGLPNPLVLQSRLHGIFETFFQKTSTCLFIPAQKSYKHGHNAQKIKFSINNFTAKILNGKLHFLCSD